MTDHLGKRRTPMEWIKDDLSKTNGPGKIKRTIRAHPIILLKFVVRLAILVGGLWLLLTLLGKGEAFGDLGFFAAMAAAWRLWNVSLNLLGSFTEG